MLKIFFLLFLFFVIFVASSVLSLVWRLLSGPRQQKSPREKSQHGEDMVRDPQCGMFLPKQDAVAASIRGQQHWFCSAECRDSYRKQG